MQSAASLGDIPASSWQLPISPTKIRHIIIDKAYCDVDGSFLVLYLASRNYRMISLIDSSQPKPDDVNSLVH
jgi:hypothetical protein